MKARLVIPFIVAMAFAFSCSPEKKESGDATMSGDSTIDKHEAQPDVTATEAGKPEFTVDQIFKSQLGNVFSSYVALKDAFVDSDNKKVTDQVKKTEESLAKVDMTLVKDAAHNDWMVYQEELSSSLKKIREATDLEQRREHFSKLSYSLYKTIKAFGLSGATAYYDHCPMAFDNKGAYWLSDNDKIRNPYFGEKMLTCGSVQETLK